MTLERRVEEDEDEDVPLLSSKDSSSKDLHSENICRFSISDKKLYPSVLLIMTEISYNQSSTLGFPQTVRYIIYL